MVSPAEMSWSPVPFVLLPSSPIALHNNKEILMTAAKHLFSVFDVTRQGGQCDGRADSSVL